MLLRLHGKKNSQLKYQRKGQVLAHHLDHIKPCYYFDLTNISHRQECFHYTNIQPLWELDNLRKNKRMEIIYENKGQKQNPYND